jgi:hypothetical protein
MPVGAPKGNRNHHRGLKLRSACLMALRRYSRHGEEPIKEGEALGAIFKKLIVMALDGDVIAAREIFDRGFGKPLQSVDVTQTIKRSVEDLTDEELLAIARSGRAALTESEPSEPSEIH